MSDYQRLIAACLESEPVDQDWAGEVLATAGVTLEQFSRDLDDRMTRRAKLAADPVWQAAVSRFVSYFLKQESEILLPTSQTEMLATYLPQG